jgi:hypothetical protein
MTYQVFCTFDLKNQDQRGYDLAYADLAKIGLARVVVAGNGNKIVMPTTSAIGNFTGTTSEAVRDEIMQRVKAVFSQRGFKYEVFIVVGSNGTWSAYTN